MTIRFYLSSTLGDGLSRQTAFRSKLSNFIVNDGTQDFWDWSNRVTVFRFCIATCASALHTTIAADPDVVALSPELADVPAINAYLDGLVGTLPAPVATALEAAGIPVNWLVAGTTRRQLWRFISNWHVVVQALSNNPTARTFLASSLGLRVNQVPAAQRNAIAAWMTARGIDSSWITGTTLIRTVVIFIIQNGNFPIMNNGPVTF